MKYVLSLILFVFLGFGTFHIATAECSFSAGDIRSDFKNCNPNSGIDPTADPNYAVTESGSDFRTFTALMINRIQIIASILAIGIIVWIGLILVLPLSAEAKEQYKSKVGSVLIGFFVMLAASIIITGLINLTYEVFK